MSTDLFYKYESCELWFRNPEVDTLQVRHPQSWVVDSSREDYVFVRILRSVEFEPTLHWEGLHIVGGGGYGLPVHDANQGLVGYAYATFPATPGVHAYLGKKIWPRGPLADEPFLAPDTAEEMQKVTRQGDPFPQRAGTPAGFNAALDELDRLQARFV